MATTSWQKVGGDPDGNWSDSLHWDNGVPQDGDIAVLPIISGKPAYNITLDVNTANLSSLTVAQPKDPGPVVVTLAISSFTLNVTGTGTSLIGGHITIAGGTINNSGDFTLGSDSIGSRSDLIGWGTLNVSGHYTDTGTLQASGGILDVFGTVDSGVVLSIDSTTSSTLKIENGATSAAAISITNSTQTLEIGSSRNLTINAAQNVTLGTIKLDGGTLTDGSGITFGTNGSANSGFVTGKGTLAADLALATGSTSTGSTITASGTGTLDLTGTIDSNLVLVIDASAINTLKIDSSSTVSAVSITSTNQTLQIGSGKSVTISTAQTVTNGTLQIDGTLTDTSGVTIGGTGTINGSGSLAAGTNLSGSGTVSISFSGSNTGTITASGATLDLQGTVSSGGRTLVVADVANSVLKISGSGSNAADAITLDTSNKTLDIASNLTIIGAQNVTSATIQLDGGSLTDASGITIDTGAHLTGQGTITAGTSSGTYFEGVGSVTASGGILAFVTRVDATTQTAFDIGSGATLKFESLVGASGVNPVVTFDSGANTLDLSSISSGAGSLDAKFFGHIGGFTFGDGIKVASATSVTLSGDHTQITVFDNANDLGTITFTAPINDGYFSVSGGNTIVELVCFMPGTMISTPDGARSVETFKAGDLVLTSEGRAVPVRWIGRQTVSRVFGDPLRVLPIRITADALGYNLPVRDLLLSPDHALLIDGVLVHAGALVNGTSVLRESNVPLTYTYYHLELDDHSLILAEGVAAETFVDNVARLAFDNWDEHEALYPQGKSIVEMDYPRAKAYRQVPRAIRERLARRAVAQSRDAAVA